MHGIADTTNLEPDVIRLLASRDFTYAPTLTAYESRFIYAEGADFAKEATLMEAFPAEIVRKVLSQEYRAEMRAGRDLTEAHAQFDRAAANLKTLQRADVRIGLGSDHTPTRFPGYMEHRELELMVRAGLSPLEAIVAGTPNSFANRGALEDMGTLEAGKHADIIILDANPLDAIVNTRKIHQVFKEGRAADRSALRAAFASTAR